MMNFIDMKLKLLFRPLIQFIVVVSITVMAIPIANAQNVVEFEELVGLYEKNNLEKIFSISDQEIDSLKDVRSLRLLGALSDQNGLFQKSSRCLGNIIKYHKDSLLPMDIVSYSQAIIETNEYGKLDSLLSFYPSNNKWVSHMKDVAKSRDFFRDLENRIIAWSPIDVKIFTEYGISHKDDSIYYSTQYIKGKRINLIETAIILTHKEGVTTLVSGEYRDGVVSGIKQTIEDRISIRTKEQLLGINKLKRSEDILYSVRSTNGESMKIRIETDKLSNFSFNSDLYDTSMPFYDENSERLYFCSNNPEGFGGWDIYYSDFDGEKWSTPINAGGKINTPFNEIFPLVNNQGLMFASDGRFGKGGFDNFLFSFEKNESFNLNGYNSTLNDFCLLDLGKQCIGIRGDSLVAYAEGLEKVKNTYVADHMRFVSMIKPLKLEEIKKDNVVEKDTVVENELIAALQNQIKHKMYFDFDSSNLRDIEKVKADSLKKVFEKIETFCFYGSSDGVGERNYNYKLAYQRVTNSIKFYIEKLGVDFLNIQSPILFGEIRNPTDQEDLLARNVTVSNHFFSTRYKIVIAIKNIREVGINNLIGSYNLTLEDVERINLISIEELQDRESFFVGIQEIYTVAKDDTLSEIAVKYNCKIRNLKKVNNLNGTMIVEGSVLIIPMPDNKSMKINQLK